MQNKTLIMGAVGIILIATLFQIVKLSSEPELPEPAADSADSPVTSQYSYTDILDNHEFKTAMQQAVLDNDQDAALALQEKALEIARAARLSELEIQLLSAQKGLQFMQFNAKRQLFVKGFEHRYQNLLPIDDIKQAYPEAQDLFARSEALIAQRDERIRQVAMEMAGGDEAQLPRYLQLAKEQWLQRSGSKTNAPR